MTLILRLLAKMRIDSVPLIGALAVANSIHDSLQIEARVRWPNDVVVEGSKVAGLIAEGRQQGDSLEYVLLGVGINANFESSALRDVNVSVTTLMDHNGGPVDVPKLLCNILLQLEELLLLAESDRSKVLELLRRRDLSIGRSVRVVTDDRLIVGVFAGYESLDAIVVESGGERVIVPTPSAILVEYFD